MIFDSKVGSGISGALRYVQGPGKDENGHLREENGRAELLGGQGFGFDVHDDRTVEIARRLMEQNGRPEMQGDKKCYCEKDAMHISLSWARGQKPSREEQIEASQEFLKALGMENSMAVYYAHKDKSHDHVHVIASRIDPETRMAYNDYQRMYKGMGRAIRWEREVDRPRGEVPKEREWCHRLADATRDGLDSKKLFEELFKNEATVRKTKLDLSFAFGEKFGPELEAGREQFIKDANLVRLKEYKAGKTRAYTTPEIWRDEAKALANARRLREQSGHLVPQKTLEKHAKGFTLTDEQKKALWHATRDNGLSLISGEAGTGKSRTLQAIREAYLDQGYKVRGMAFTNKVTQNLQRDGFDASTIAAELLRLKYSEGHWDEKTIGVIDEAAQLSTKDMAELMRHAERTMAKLIMAGDRRQLGSIDKGGLYGTMEKRFGSARLTEVMRNKDPEQKRAFNAMHERMFKKAVDIFREKGSIRWNDTPEQSAKALAEEYTKNWLENPEATRLIMAASNDDADKLNQFARDLRRQHGKLGPDVQLDTDKGPKQFAVGDRLSMTETPNAKDKTKGLINGAFGRVEAIRDLPNGQKELTFKLDRKKGEQVRMFKFTVGMNKDAKEVSGINHGYASTVYKAQGDTIDETYVQHDRRSSAPTNYVELSRHADKVKLYVSREDTPSYDDLAAQLKSGRDKTSAHDYQVHEGDREKLNQPIQEKEQEMGLRRSVEYYVRGYDNEQGKYVDENLTHSSYLTQLSNWIRPEDQKGTLSDAARNTTEQFKPSKLKDKVGEVIDRALGGKPDKEPEIEESPMSGPKTRIDQKVRETYEFMKEIAQDVLGMVKSKNEHSQEHEQDMGMER